MTDHTLKILTVAKKVKSLPWNDHISDNMVSDWSHHVMAVKLHTASRTSSAWTKIPACLRYRKVSDTITICYEKAKSGTKKLHHRRMLQCDTNQTAYIEDSGQAACLGVV